jgi:transposase
MGPMASAPRQFSAEFKLEAVRLAAASPDRPAAVARKLGIRADMLRTWRRQFATAASAADAFPGRGQVTSQDDELRRVKRELAVVRQGRDFLRTAASGGVLRDA